jgi:hypothetical protein
MSDLPPRLVESERPALSDQQRIARLQSRVKALEGEVATLRARHGEDTATIRELKDQIDRLRRSR